MGEAHDNKRYILTVDDDRILLARLKAGLREAGYEIRQATSGEQALQLIAERAPDLAILDISMPGMSGIELAHNLRQNTAIPFMFLSSCEEVDIARQAAENGAIGYLVKPANIRHIIPAIEAALARSEEIMRLRSISAELEAALESGRRASALMRSQLQQMVDYHIAELTSLNQQLLHAHKSAVKSKAHARKLARQANQDALTELPNRHWLAKYLPAALERAARAGRMLALLYLDLDGFKAINDAMGHLAGDELLRAAAWRMKSALKPSDTISRHGGDEFVIIVEQVTGESDASHVAQRMAEVLKNPFELPHGRGMVGASIGISLYPRDGRNAQELLRNADLAMYHAKSGGKGHYRFYESRLA